MRTREQILEHLDLDELSDLDELGAEICAAEYFEEKYQQELASGNYDYRLSCDMPLIVEGKPRGRIECLERKYGVVFYEIHWFYHGMEE